MTPQQFFSRMRKAERKPLRKVNLDISRANPAYGGGWRASARHESTESEGYGDKITDAIEALHDRLLHRSPQHSRFDKQGVAVPYDYRGRPKPANSATGKPFEARV